MKFMRLEHAKNEKVTYTVNIESIACIETYIDSRGEPKTYIQSKDFENGRLHVKETEEEILGMLEQHERMKQFSKYMR